MKTKVEKITPKYAMEVLDTKNPRNRSVAESTVQAYATDMKNGRWLLTHQGIAFDENGSLIDGQHRLWAVVFSNREVEMNVTRGIPLSALKNGLEMFTMDAIDRNRPRTVGQQFSLCHGIANPNNMAAACRAISTIISPNIRSTKMGTSNALLIFNLYEKDLIATLRALDKRRQRGPIHGLVAMYHHAEQAHALEFCHQISTLEDLKVGSRLLVRFLDQMRPNTDYDYVCRAVANSLFYFAKNKNVQRLSDISQGREWIVSLFPSITKQIRESLRPCDASIAPTGRLRISGSQSQVAKAKAAVVAS
jgi:hypothetical protein